MVRYIPKLALSLPKTAEAPGACGVRVHGGNENTNENGCVEWEWEWEWEWVRGATTRTAAPCPV